MVDTLCTSIKYRLLIIFLSLLVFVITCCTTIWFNFLILIYEHSPNPWYFRQQIFHYLWLRVYNSWFFGKTGINRTNILLHIGYSSIFNLESNKSLSCSSATGISVFNADIAQKTGSPNNLVGVTFEQLKNAEYLQSIGFPIEFE